MLSKEIPLHGLCAYLLVKSLDHNGGKWMNVHQNVQAGCQGREGEDWCENVELGKGGGALLRALSSGGISWSSAWLVLELSERNAPGEMMPH